MRTKDLHFKFRSIGSLRKNLTNQLCFLIPLIYEKKIYKTYGFSSIFEYGQKLAGLSQFQIDLSLKLYEKTKDFNFFRKAVYQVGIYKVALLVGVLNKENEKFLYDKLIKLSKRALEIFAKEYREKQIKLQSDKASNISEFVLSFHDRISNILRSISYGDLINTNQSHSNDDWSFLSTAFASAEKMTIGLDLDLQKKFNILKEKLKLSSNSEAILKIFELAMSALDKKPSEKVEIENFISESQKIPDLDTFYKYREVPINLSKLIKFKFKPTISKTENRSSRYISTNIKKHILERTDQTCSYPNCNRAVSVFHHSDHFSNSKSHDSVIGLCKIHHEIVHALSNTKADQLFFEIKNKSLKFSSSA